MKHFRLLFFTVAIFLSDAEAFTFVSLKSSEINMRIGPGKEYPITWVFMRANLPMILVAEFDQWRKVKFFDGTDGWVHKNMISRKNTVIVIKDHAIMYKYSSKSHPIARIEKDVIMKVIKKEANYVKVDINNMKGWVARNDVWGINEGE
jgi:SH3-like domain-containing protein